MDDDSKRDFLYSTTSVYILETISIEQRINS